MFFSNAGVREDFIAYEHYVTHTHNRLALSFHVTINYHKGYIVLVHAKDGEHTKSIWLVKTFSSPNFVPTSPSFCQIEVEHYRPSTRDKMLCAPIQVGTPRKVLSGQWTRHMHQFE